MPQYLLSVNQPDGRAARPEELEPIMPSSPRSTTR